MGILGSVGYQAVHFILYGLLVLTFAAFLGRASLRPGWIAAIAGVGLALFAIGIADEAAGGMGPDFYDAFYPTGQIILRGEDPIETLAEVRVPPLNPPSSYHVFAAMALLPLRPSYVFWTLISGLSCAGLVPLGHRLLVDRGLAPLSRPILALLTSLVCLSLAARSILMGGLLSGYASIALTAALFAQGRGRPVWAGFALGLGTIKIGTLFPFLLLFHRRRDVVSWLVVIVFIFVTCAAIGRLADAPRRVSVYLGVIKKLSEPGRMNDYSYAGAINNDMVGLDYALYRIGLRDRTAVAWVQNSLLLLLGAALAVRVLRPGPRDEAANCSLVALFSTIFFYHRVNDTILLAIPLVYATSRSVHDSGRSRRWFVAAALSMVAAMSVQRNLVKFLQSAVVHGKITGFVGRSVEALILPYGTWMILLALFCLWEGTRETPNLDCALDEFEPPPGR